MGFNEGRIVLDSDTGIYFPGETLYGNLRFRQDEVKTVRGIYVEVKGYAKTDWWNWMVLHTSGNAAYFNHTANEEYFREKHYLVGGPKGQYRLQEGDHNFRFTCRIPPNCPSSYKGTRGSVEYRISVVVDKKWNFNEKKEHAFQVKAPLNVLKVNPDCLSPMEFSFEDTYCSCCVSAGSCQTVVKLPQSGFSIGQTIPVEFNCTNDSSVTINRIMLQIVKKTTFIGHYVPGRIEEEEKIVEISTGSIPAGTTRIWLLGLSIPVMDPCNLAGCRIIDVDYYIKVKVQASWCHHNTEKTQRTVIGDVL